jgi:prevent-host-death family protein
MKTLTVSNARKEIYNLVDEISEEHEPILITSKRNNAVIISEQDWEDIQETLYLTSIPKMRESIQKGMKTNIEDCSEEIDW